MTEIVVKCEACNVRGVIMEIASTDPKFVEAEIRGFLATGGCVHASGKYVTRDELMLRCKETRAAYLAAEEKAKSDPNVVAASEDLLAAAKALSDAVQKRDIYLEAARRRHGVYELWEEHGKANDAALAE